jgi:uncharacterized Zn finger protein (UPF0148 family)
VIELREHHRKRAEQGLPKLGDTVPCQRCGSPTPRRSRRGQIYCPSCSKERRKETDKAFLERNAELLRLRRRVYDARRKNDPKRVAALKAWRQTVRGRFDLRMTVLLRASALGKRTELRSVVGYSVADLRRHLERQFANGMSWDNMKEWQIDHIVPKIAFNYTSPDDPEFRACWALTNLRPLWKQANIRKSTKRTHLL